jgi:hypothetical protein
VVVVVVTWRTLVPALAAFMAGALWTAPAAAYRPFDGTDASVPELGDLELELGPVGYVRSMSARTLPHQELIVPKAIFNFGFLRGWELVLQGSQAVVLGDLAGESRVQLVDTGLFLKGVLRAGTLQERTGPSVAVEFGTLLPTTRPGEGTPGVTAIGIISNRWEHVTVHTNAAAALTRDQRLELFGSVILEGPHRWHVRPIVEAVVDDVVGGPFMASGLAGAIWRASGSVSVDLGVRGLVMAGVPAVELRAGLTWAWSLGWPQPHHMHRQRLED